MVYCVLFQLKTAIHQFFSSSSDFNSSTNKSFFDSSIAMIFLLLLLHRITTTTMKFSVYFYFPAFVDHTFVVTIEWSRVDIDADKFNKFDEFIVGCWNDSEATTSSTSSTDRIVINKSEDQKARKSHFAISSQQFYIINAESEEEHCRYDDKCKYQFITWSIESRGIRSSGEYFILLEESESETKFPHDGESFHHLENEKKNRSLMRPSPLQLHWHLGRLSFEVITFVCLCNTRKSSFFFFICV